MNPLSRRHFFALGAAPLVAAPAKKKILILGGTGYLGPATVAAAQARGHELTLFNRGKTRPDLFKGNIEQLHGDRDPDKGDGIKALAGRKWDVVIDNSGYFPRMVKASADLLAPNCGRYIFISSISVYKDNSKEGQDESTAVATIADPTIEKITEESYGALKALCEQASQKAFGARATIVRPGYIVGPDDPSGRFTYWPVRFDRGGEVFVPGAPADPVQFVDVRDLGTWLIHLAENDTPGVFNAASKPMQWGALVKACRSLAPAGTTETWVPTKWILDNKAWQFPIWAPYDGEYKGFHTWNTQRAIKAGLKFRPYAETVKDTLAWYKTQKPGERTRLAGPDAAKEAELLAAFKKSRG